MQRIILAIIISYIFGAIPTAYIFGRLIKGVDIRNFGSGNVGATNALRLLGRGWGVAILILDILKGFLPVFIFGGYLSKFVNFNQSVNLFICIGLASILGHTWTIFLGFKGGKGVATTFGVLIAFAFKIPGLNIALGFTVLIWLLVFLSFRFISLASISAALSFPVLIIMLRQPFVVILISIFLSLFIILRHKSNITRLLKRQESRISFKR
jgi:glycerol-3-phosphate acyltransferase PlsY